MFDLGVVIGELARVPAGADLAAVLARIDRSALNGYELVEVVKATSRQVAHYQAELLASVRETAYCPPGDEASPPERTERPAEYASDEIRLALAITRRAADTLLGLAYELTERLPAVGEALRSGRIDLPKARVLDEETAALPPPVAQEIVGHVLPVAGGLTTGQLRIRLRKLVISADPDAAARRQQQALAMRRVEHGLDPTGTATLAGYHLPPDRAATAAARIDALARAAKRAGDARSMDALRADLFLDILNGEHPTAETPRRGGVELVVPLATLMGLSEQPGAIKGWGPVLAEVARKVADGERDGAWRFSVTGGEAGAVVAHGRLRRRPPAGEAAFVRARDRTCRTPGCRTPAHRCDLDHTRAWEDGGPTTPANLGVLCRHCHGYKHSDGVCVTQPTPGTFVWRTRLGHTYTTGPPAPI
ncbi:HNH endonuclease signature motif containing protein [Phytohabitans houttuyneae]|uniref:HNH nuclease domain-containing protein n=1 Tax=Phytohabitans houttuyneae TaxID=1076126 RepID=A0A6V8KJL5_9ACTN|nr:HNH endonuclease signature motif containing protein [Phytohabitans houttuyneae]GFJ82339.1 hypothetical protein Phou_065190 [Phytohabitans houttuyneae]